MGEQTKTESKSESKKSEFKKTKLRCHYCNKKLKMIYFTCKCNYKFCDKHLNPHSHKCSYDAKRAKSEEIKKNNPKLGSKIVKI
jgi:predicted nucleic acid binding AN1-type Zn finger protein